MTADIVIESLDASGDGVGRYRGEPLAVPFTIPGERVRVRLGQRGEPAQVTATLVEVLRPSPHRIPARCPHFGPDAEPGIGPCGGCSWQHIAYPEQLRLKTAAIETLVRATARAAPAVQPTLPGTPIDNPWGYRHKLHFVFASGFRSSATRGDAPLAMGHYVRGSRRVLPVRECPVHDERGNGFAFRLQKAFAKANVAVFGESTSRASARTGGTLQSLALRVGANTPELMATLVVSTDNDKRLRVATRRVLERDPPSGFHLNLHPRGDALVFGRDTRKISGTDRMREEVAGIRFLISPTAFFQTNIGAAEILVRLVLESVPDGATVLDLYAGAGLFALPLARQGHQVTAVEENRAAVADGEASLRLNRIPAERCRFIARPVESALASLRGADVVILDPPREGCAPGVIDHVFGRLQPSRAVYISCSPEALGVELPAMSAHGYRVDLVQPVDMFPHTAHIETVIVLSRGGGVRRPGPSGRGSRSSAPSRASGDRS